jgi:hypothetical protein
VWYTVFWIGWDYIAIFLTGRMMRQITHIIWLGTV